MSKQRTCALLADIANSRSFLGRARWGTVDGSTRSLNIAVIVLLPEPCSPKILRIGVGMFGFKAVINQATIRIKSFSLTYKENFAEILLNLLELASEETSFQVFFRIVQGILMLK